VKTHSRVKSVICGWIYLLFIAISIVLKSIGVEKNSKG
jgi:hypothetical protein